MLPTDLAFCILSSSCYCIPAKPPHEQTTTRLELHLDNGGRAGAHDSGLLALDGGSEHLDKAVKLQTDVPVAVHLHHRVDEDSILRILLSAEEETLR